MTHAEFIQTEKTCPNCTPLEPQIFINFLWYHEILIKVSDCFLMVYEKIHLTQILLYPDSEAIHSVCRWYQCQLNYGNKSKSLCYFSYLFQNALLTASQFNSIPWSLNRQLQQPTPLIKLHNNSVHVGLKFCILLLNLY